MQHLTISWDIGPRDILHIPWQGSWRVPAARLREGVALVGAHLPVIASERSGTWTLGSVTAAPDDAVWGLRVQGRGQTLELELTGAWQTPPAWRVSACGSYARLLAGVRRLLPPPRRRPPSLARAFILDVHDARGRLIQTFGDLTTFLRQLAALDLAKGSLLYLPGWAGPYDGNYPDYEPSSEAGGAAGLARLAAAARGLGAWVAPHLNHWALTKSRAGDYRQLLPHILRDARGRRAGWPGMTLMGISHPLWYVDPSSEPWLDLMTERLSRLKELGVGAVFLDQAAPPLGDNWRRQTRCFMQTMRTRFPGLLLGSESVHADIIDTTGFAQLWGPAWTVMPEQPLLRPSPLLADAVRPWLSLVGHLATPAPYPALCAWTHFVRLAEKGAAHMFGEIWRFHAASGVVPTARMVTTRPRANDRLLRRLFMPRETR